MKKLFFYLLLWVTVTPSLAQVTSPEEFLGYPIGASFSFHHQTIEYFKQVANQSPLVQIRSYGKTYEGRELLYAIITSEKNMDKLEELRQANLYTANLTSENNTESPLPIVWFSHNVHGNEASSMETSMQLLYELATQKHPQTQEWLDNMIIMIDPCENPDGRDRYVYWYKQKRNRITNSSKYTWEHQEPWPSGRFNHYLFDLNRDWAWQTQIESQQRTKVYQQWMPHIHIDLHEMNPESTYFFGPAAEPMHEEITNWQKDFHQIAGEHHAQHFDKQGWSYFSKEVYDLFYPSYGDTWPMFNGAIGFTFEQSGSGRAGVSYLQYSGDTITLKERAEHHLLASLSTLEIAYKKRKDLLHSFKKYFEEGPKKGHQTFIVNNQGSNQQKVNALKELLEQQGITYAYADTKKDLQGFNYEKNKKSNFSVNKGDLVVSTRQPKGKLVSVLFEPKSSLSDSLTYDLTAWSVPYIFDVPACMIKGNINTRSTPVDSLFTYPDFKSEHYTYILPWDDLNSSIILSQLLQKKYKCRMSQKEFSSNTSDNKHTFPAGSILISKASNQTFSQEEHQWLVDLAKKYAHPLFTTASGMVLEGKDFGSMAYPFIKTPKIALLAGEGLSPTAVGELWYFFEQILQYPIHIIDINHLEQAKLEQYTVIIAPSGKYEDHLQKELLRYGKEGGKLVLLEKAINIATTDEDTALSKAIKAKNKSENRVNKYAANSLLYAMKERERLAHNSAGSIYEIDLDISHPIAYGKSASTFIMKRNNTTYPLLKSGWNIGTFQKDGLISGFVGHQLKEKIPMSLSIGQEQYGSGSLIYFTDSPVFRGFWRGNMLLFSNTLFFNY
ncbi:M14 metallopeptidase family protein [Algivirga pacifica]|uniref:M14 family metallopeptidase n=1 Tax=Algivirga pacifica TaxID=1162670 RepID=A0ABP9D8Z7_9BACT